ncbi:unnamed protein product, partial [marine sediment metagenome]
MDAQTIENIKKAQGIRGIPKTDHLVHYKNIGELLDERQSKFNDKIYLIYYNDDKNEHCEYSYAEFNQRVNKIANFMSEKLGIKRGDRVGTVMFNHSDTVCIYMAVMKLGG